MSTNLRCPECNQELSTLDIGQTAECQRCGTKLTVRGKGALAAVDILLQLILGGIVIICIFSEHVAGYVIAGAIIVGWIVLMNRVTRKVLTVHRAER